MRPGDIRDNPTTSRAFPDVYAVCQHGAVTGRVAASETVSPGAQRPGWADPRLPLVLLPAVILVGILAELSLVNAGLSTDGILTDAASGLAFSLAGLIAWHRRPGNRVGPIMTGIGLAWFGGDFLYGPAPIVGPLSFFVQASARVLFAWLLLAFPSGRLGSSLHRWAVGLIAGLAGALAIFQLVTLDPASICPCPSSPFSFAADWPAAAELENASAAVGMGMTLILVPLVVRRIVVASPPARRSLLPVLAGGAFSLLSVTPDLVSRLAGTTPEVISWLPIVWVALPAGFLLVLLDARVGRAGVTDLLVEMESYPGPMRLEQAAARALRDSSVSIAYWLEDLDAYVDAHGNRVELSDLQGRSITPVERDGALVAALLHDAALDEEPRLLDAVARAIGMAIENSQLQVELQARLAEVRASRARIVTAGDAERRRLERDLHDGAQQRLVALSLALRRAQSRLAPAADEGLAASLQDASQLVRDALGELRELARGLHPAILTESGLPGAIAALAARSAVPVEVLAVPEVRLPAELEAGAYFFVSEALTNVAKHAPASRASVRVSVDDGRLLVEVADDGPGGAAPRPGSGLQGLEDRMAAIGGGFEVRSAAGHGTRLRGWLPLP